MQVSLRAPLDQAFLSENRKLARVIFEQEMVEKVEDHQIMKEQMLEQTKAKII